MGCAQINSNSKITYKADPQKTQNQPTPPPENKNTPEQGIEQQLAHKESLAANNQPTPPPQKPIIKTQIKSDSIPEVINIQFQLNEKLLKSLTMNANATIKDLIDNFKNYHPIFPEHFPIPKFRTPSNIYLIDSNAVISYFLEKDSHDLVVLVEPAGLTEFPWDADIKYVHQIEILAKPLTNPFGVALFNTKTKRICIEDDFVNRDVDDSKINLYSNASAYCNGMNNYLYISGGEDVGKENLNSDSSIANFWIVDLNKKMIDKESLMMPVSKKNHSMIFIPERYVFIAGGNSRETFYYDIHLKTFHKWTPLNKETIQPALALINNCYLYAFTAFTDREKSFEKNNLRLTRTNWDIIVPKLSPTCNFTQELFGVCHHKKDSVLFIGGDSKSTGQPNYCSEFNYASNTLQQSAQTFEDIELSEKCFISVGSTHAFLFPNFQRGAPMLLGYIKPGQMFGKIPFTPDIQNSGNVIENTEREEDFELPNPLHKVKSEKVPQDRNLRKNLGFEIQNKILPIRTTPIRRRKTITGGVEFFAEI